MAFELKESSLLDIANKEASMLDSSNNNNHWSIEKKESVEEWVRKYKEVIELINRYRDELSMSAVVDTDSVIKFLREIEIEITSENNVILNDSELYRLREEYFVIAKKKPFLWWKKEELETKIEELKEHWRLWEDYLRVKKSKWKK